MHIPQPKWWVLWVSNFSLFSAVFPFFLIFRSVFHSFRLFACIIRSIQNMQCRIIFSAAFSDSISICVCAHWARTNITIGGILFFSHIFRFNLLWRSVLVRFFCIRIYGFRVVLCSCCAVDLWCESVIISFFLPFLPYSDLCCLTCI